MSAVGVTWPTPIYEWLCRYPYQCILIYKWHGIHGLHECRYIIHDTWVPHIVMYKIDVMWMPIYEWRGLQVRWQSVSGRCRNQSRPNLSLGIPLPSVPWIFCLLVSDKTCKRRGRWVSGGKRIYSQEKREWMVVVMVVVGVHRGQGGGFCGPGIKAYPPMINNNTQCKTHNVQHHTKSS